ncbi:MAG: cytochrome C biogenesis protein [Acidobacteria bacterium]|nr:MAG: cytochrome C biogenesis protein [Acidobacteriota bacterium]
MEHELSIPIAFVAGVVSFLSPCVLPLVPGYISMLSGESIEALKAEESALVLRRIISNSLAFVAGFSAVFVGLGASATTVGNFLREEHSVFNIVAGIVIIVFGIHLTGLIKIPFLYREARVNAGAPKKGMAGAFVLGFAFAFGWTPCIGPILAAILALAANKENLYQGMFLLGVYSAGLAIPFLATSIGLSQFLKFYGRFRKHLQVVEVASGVLLIAIGILIAFHKFTVLSGYLTFLNRFSL